MSVAHFLLEIVFAPPTGMSPRKDPDHAGGTTYPIWPGINSSPEGHGLTEGCLGSACTTSYMQMN